MSILVFVFYAVAILSLIGIVWAGFARNGAAALACIFAGLAAMLFAGNAATPMAAYLYLAIGSAIAALYVGWRAMTSSK